MELELAKWQDNKDGLTPKNSNTVWTSDHHDDESNQYDNALIMKIQFTGGYGMFVDDWDTESHDKLKLIICHDCAHMLCELFPGIGKIIDPFSSHAHTSQFIANHPEHLGWDYLTREELDEYCNQRTQTTGD